MATAWQARQSACLPPPGMFRMLQRIFSILLGPVAALMLASGCVTAPKRDADVAIGRSVMPLDRGWQFQFAGSGPKVADAGWQAVDLPHNWNRLGEYRVEPSGSGNNARGIGWYRLSLDAGRLPAGRRHFLQFDGVGNIADVWVNGVHAGRHAGAFSRFRFDVTESLRSSGANLIEVRADNSKPAPGSTTEHVIPLLGDFFIHGGIYRGVSVVSVAPQHIDLLDHGGPGIYTRTVSIAPDRADVQVTTRLRNAAAEPRTLTLTAEIQDADGRPRAQASSRVRLDASSAATRVQQLALPRPRLWNGREDPYLYRVVVELRDGPRVLDRVVEPLGIRSFRIDPNRGFFLNGKRLPLHGVSRHQDWLGKGWAITREDHALDMALIAEMGANTVRFAHYQHAREWFEEADRAGMVVWAELPFVNKVSFGDMPASPELTANARLQLVELIRQNYNHPSVVTWGTGNEVDIDLAFGRLGPRADARPLLRNLHELAKLEDPDRPTVVADCCEDTPGDKADYLPVLAGTADLMGYNRYFGWYYGQTGDLGPHLDALHAKHPAIPISVSEFGAGGALSQHTDNPTGGPINTSGRPHPEEFQSWWHEQTWPQLARREFLWGNWIWNMFDFSSDIRKEGDATDINDKGLVSFDRKVKKDGFFYYKAQWSREPVVHITSRRYVDRAYPVADIRVYSNAAAVDLALNGRALGTVPCIGRICTVKDVALVPGENLVTAQAAVGGQVVHDRVRWNAPDAAGGLAINVGDLAGFVSEDNRRVGSDHWFDGGTPRRLSPAVVNRTAGPGDLRFRGGYREGRFDYSIPMPEGQWRVKLLFLEPQESGKPRSFDVTLNGEHVLQAFDPAVAAGGALRIIERSFVAETRNNRILLRFAPVSGEAVLSGLEIRPLGPPRPR